RTTVSTATSATWRPRSPRSSRSGRVLGADNSARMRMRVEVRLAAALVRHVRVQLGRRKIGAAEHLLHRAQVGAPCEQVRRERMAEQMRMDALRFETRLLGQAAQDQERAGTGERAAAGVEEELGAVAAVEERTPADLVAAQGLDRL